MGRGVDSATGRSQGTLHSLAARWCSTPLVYLALVSGVPGGVQHDRVLARLGLENVTDKLHSGRLVAHKPDGRVQVQHKLKLQLLQWDSWKIPTGQCQAPSAWALVYLSSVCLGLEVRSQLLPLT